MLSSEGVDEFKKLYLKEFGVMLTDGQALDMGTKLVRLVKVVYEANLPKKFEPKVDRIKQEDLGLK